MIRDEAALIAACLAEPKDDLPKLVFADWLEEQGKTTEAWRLRQYLWVYRPIWKEGFEWQADPEWTSEDRRALLEELVETRRDELWRLVILTLVEAIWARYPLELNGPKLHWPDGWNVERYQHILAQAKCLIILYSCGIQVHLVKALQATGRMRDAFRWRSGAAAGIAEALRQAARRENVAASATTKAARALERMAEDYVRKRPWEPIQQAFGSLWWHIRDTKPPW